MRKEIESLEELNTLLGEDSFDMNFWRARNGLEQLAWHLLAHHCPYRLKRRYARESRG